MAELDNKLNDPLGTAPKVPSVSEALKQTQDITRQQVESTKRLGELEAQKIEKTPLIQAEKLKAEKAYRDTARATQEADIAAAEKDMSQFRVSQDSIGGMSALGTAILMLGQALGRSGGQQSAMGAIQGMTGMMQGYSKGRAEEFKRNQIEFERNFKILQDKIKRANDKFQAALAEMPYNTIDAQTKVAQALAELDSPILKEKYNKQGLVETAGFLKTLFDASQKAADRANQLAVARGKAEGKTGLKPGAESQKNYVGNNVMLSDIKSLMAQLQDPELKKLVDDNRLAGFLMENTGAAIAQLITTDMDPKLQKFLSTVARVRNNEYLRVSGKAVTGGEAMRNYNVVAQPGDNSQNMLTKLGGMADQIDRSIQMDRKMFPSLPDLTGVGSGSQPFNIDTIQLAPEEQAPKPISTQAEYDALPPGTLYIEDGKTYRKPK